MCASRVSSRACGVLAGALPPYARVCEDELKCLLSFFQHTLSRASKVLLGGYALSCHALFTRVKLQLLLDSYNSHINIYAHVS